MLLLAAGVLCWADIASRVDSVYERVDPAGEWSAQFDARFDALLLEVDHRISEVEGRVARLAAGVRDVK